MLVKNLPANAGYAKYMSLTQAFDSLGQEDSLEKEMAIHSSIFAWKTPWAEEPGGLTSMESQRDITEHHQQHHKG